MSKLVIKKNQIPDQYLRASQSSYGHSGSGSGYGGHGSYSSGGGDCCPLVVDPLTFAALIGFIGLATYFFREFIALQQIWGCQYNCIALLSLIALKHISGYHFLSLNGIALHCIALHCFA